jgi:hypothetical protein
MVRVKLSMSVVVLALLSLVSSLLVTIPGMLAAGVTVEAASPAPIETPRADGPKPILDPSVGDGGVSAFLAI